MSEKKITSLYNNWVNQTGTFILLQNFLKKKRKKKWRNIDTTIVHRRYISTTKVLISQENHSPNSSTRIFHTAYHNWNQVYTFFSYNFLIDY